MILQFVFLIAISGCLIHSCHESKSSMFQEANHFLDQMLDINGACQPTTYAVAYIGDGGGFASKFQLMASHWLRKAYYFKYQIPILVRGNLGQYSSGDECASSNHSWTCFFLPTSTCESTLLETGTLIEDERYNVWPNWNNVVPVQFKSMGFSWWWGVVLQRLFRMQPNIEKVIADKKRCFVNGGLYSWNGSVAGIHIRHGDKSMDGWKPRSLQSAIVGVQRSPECTRHGGVCNRNHRPFSKSILPDNMHAESLRDLPVYVASDDSNVLEEAASSRFMVSPAGVSQAAGAQRIGTEDLLNAKKNGAFQASIEIIRDIYYLSKCSTLVGTASSQVFRTAVAMSQASGTLRHAFVVDHADIRRIQAMSRECKVPMPLPYYTYPNGMLVSLIGKEKDVFYVLNNLKHHISSNETLLRALGLDMREVERLEREEFDMIAVGAPICNKLQCPVGWTLSSPPNSGNSSRTASTEGDNAGVSVGSGNGKSGGRAQHTHFFGPTGGSSSSSTSSSSGGSSTSSGSNSASYRKDRAIRHKPAIHKQSR